MKDPCSSNVLLENMPFMLSLSSLNKLRLLIVTVEVTRLVAVATEVEAAIEEESFCSS
jgi:hypothetical protein